VIDRLPLSEWIEFDREHPAPTFFARPAWSLALADAFNSLVPAPLRLNVEGHTAIVPTVQSRRVRLRLREHLAFPLGGYSCVLDTRGGLANEAMATSALRELGRRVDHLQIIPWPLGPAPDLPQATAIVHETAVIDCSDGFENVLTNIRGVTRRMAGQAERRGVVCECAPIGELHNYFEILKEASTGWGLPKPPISFELLHAVLDRGKGDAQLWFAKLDGAPIGGGVVLFGSEELFFWSAAMRRDFGRYRPSNALNLALIQAACARGVRWYNLGASEGLEGVARFKHDLGAKTIPYAELSLRRPAFAFYERVRHAVLARQRSA
jgi:CelD/BcsL family acetyltransferase involved in cellulose biosynthesis